MTQPRVGAASRVRFADQFQMARGIAAFERMEKMLEAVRGADSTCWRMYCYRLGFAGISRPSNMFGYHGCLRQPITDYEPKGGNTISQDQPSIDELIVEHMNKLRELATQDVEWIEQQPDLKDYTTHLAVLESNLQRHAEQMLALRERVVKQIANKCGRDGRDIYGPEIGNIRLRKHFARVAEFFTHKSAYEKRY